MEDLSESDEKTSYWRYDDDTDQPERDVLRPEPNLTAFHTIDTQHGQLTLWCAVLRTQLIVVHVKNIQSIIRLTLTVAIWVQSCIVYQIGLT